ncbi:MAG: efflux transporter outer membrane subunit [Bryobacterales bacterium]
MKFALTIPLLAVTLTAAGCGRALQRPERDLTVDPPQAWTGAATLPETGAEGDWWAYFGDNGLDQAVQRALTRNHDLRAAAQRVEAAREQVRIAGAAELPSVDLSIQRGRERRNFVGFPIPGSEGNILSTTFTNATLGVSLNWEADVWGRVKSGTLAAVADSQARQADLMGAHLSLTGQVAKAWFAAIEASHQVAVARATLESYKTSSERVRARFESGLKPSLDLRLALTEVANAEAQLQLRLEQRDRAIRQLEILLGDYPDGDHALAEDLPTVPTGVPAGLPSELVHRRPDLAAAERQLLAADARISVAKAELKPKFTLTSGAGTASNTLRDLLNNDVFVWNLIGGLTQPLFNRGRLQAGVRQNEALAAEAAASYESMMLTAYQEVESALAAENYLAGQETALETATKQSQAARDLAEQRYRLGLADIITLLASHRAALDAESQLLAVRRLRLENRVNLHLALGGGFRMTSVTTPDAKDSQAGRTRL